MTTNCPPNRTEILEVRRKKIPGQYKRRPENVEGEGQLVPQTSLTDFPKPNPNQTPPMTMKLTMWNSSGVGQWFLNQSFIRGRKRTNQPFWIIHWWKCLVTTYNWWHKTRKFWGKVWGGSAQLLVKLWVGRRSFTPGCAVVYIRKGGKK